MFLAEVIGHVVATKKDESMRGRKLLILRPQLVDEAKPTQFRNCSNTIVAVDTVGAGEGELVMFCQGSSARQAGGLKPVPVDDRYAVVPGDGWQGETRPVLGIVSKGGKKTRMPRQAQPGVPHFQVGGPIFRTCPGFPGEVQQNLGFRSDGFIGVFSQACQELFKFM